MTLPRIDRMTEGPTLGGWYMVPTVRGVWMGMDYVADWPVVGPLHDDLQFFNFPWKHYHVDGRFLTAQQQRRAVGFWKPEKFRERLTRQCIGAPLTTSDNTNRDGFPKPILMKKRCAIDMMAPPGSDVTKAVGWTAMASAFAGRVCKYGKRGFICPHQNVALGAVAAIDGVITCPLHGLRIDAASGRVLLNPG